MSAVSVSAYLSPTILRNFAISSGESGGRDEFATFIFLASSPCAPSDGRAAQPVVDGISQSLVGNFHHGDGARIRRIESAKIAEKVACRFNEIASCRQVHHGRSIACAGKSRGAEGEQRLAGLDPRRVEAHFGARRVM